MSYFPNSRGIDANPCDSPRQNVVDGKVFQNDVDSLENGFSSLHHKEGYFLEINSKGEKKLIVPPSLFQSDFLFRLILGCIPLIVSFKVFHLVFNTSFVYFPLLLMSLLLLFVAAANIYLALNSLVESQYIFAKEGNLHVYKDRLFAPIEYEIPILGIESISVGNSSNNYPWDAHMVSPTVQIGEYQVSIFERANKKQSQEFVSTLKELIQFPN